jgi:hypothetical protein
MTNTTIEELSVPFDPTQLQQKVLRRRRGMRSRLVSLIITVVLMGVLYAWKRAEFAGYLTIALVLLGVSVAWFVGFLVAYRLARRELGRVGQGTALRIGRPGVEVRGVYVSWPEVVALRAVTGRWGRAPRFEVTRHSGEPLAVPLNQMNVRPATLDLTARAYSAGRHGVDLSALDA